MSELMKLNATIVAVLAVSGLFMSAMSALVDSAFVRAHRTREDKVARIPDGHRNLMVVSSAVVSTGLIFAAANLATAAYFTPTMPPAWRIVVDGLAILALYDLGYYLLHRFVLHEWSWGSRIHAVHHRIRTPFTRDSLYVHPLETAAGVSLLLGCTWLVGPVHVWTFAWAFFIYSTLNIFIHSAFDLPWAPFRWIARLAANHDVHHASMKGGFYGSITPVWDRLFGTAR
jgi:sterol desaturase/sphingolipid hydroxylase (fatty acid hydroxylase superfamily)